jgi:hypothetical protein
VWKFVHEAVTFEIRSLWLSGMCKIPVAEMNHGTGCFLA